MAGIGFELRKILQKNTLLSIIEAYGLAGIISSGTWIMTILVMLVIGLVTLSMSFPTEVVIQFLVIVTYLMAGSLIISGLLQLLITRYMSDLVFIGHEHRILPNLLGAMLVISILAAAAGAIVLNLTGTLEPKLKVVIFTTLILLSNQWLAIILLSGMKKYYRILITMAISYGLMLGLSFSLPPSNLLGLMLIFCFCQGILTFAFLYDIIREFPADRLMSFEFLNPKKAFYSLMFCGVLYNLGVWLDKFVFWFNAGTSHQVIDVFRASYIYDLPIFIAYLAVVPGMAVFMLNMETEFADACIRFYDAVRKGATLTKIHTLKNNMVVACRQSLYAIFKVQGIALLLLILWAEDILNLLNIDLTYLHLFYIDLVGVSLQVLFMAILNVMFYLDKKMSALWLILLMAIGNLTLSAITIMLGPVFYGYGFATTMLIVSVIGMITLDKQFEDLEYQIFMLQRP